MNTKRFCALLIVAVLAGCQSVPFLKPTPAGVKNDSWNGMHLDLVQFLAEEKGFTCLAPSGVDFTPNGQAVKKTLCFKTEKCETTNRILYLDAHSMLVTSTEESRTPQTGQCIATTPNSSNSATSKPSSK